VKKKPAEPRKPIIITKMRKKKALLCNSSCDKKRVFDEYKSVGSAWHKDSIVTFNLPNYSTKRYDLFINLRATTIINTISFNCGLELPNGLQK
jgi:hypothetical protein